MVFSTMDKCSAGLPTTGELLDGGWMAMDAQIIGKLAWEVDGS